MACANVCANKDTLLYDVIVIVALTSVDLHTS